MHRWGGTRVIALLLLLGVVCGLLESVRAWGDDSGPSMVKTGISISVFQGGQYRPNGGAAQENTTCWAPVARFEVRGPVPAGGQFWVEFTKPDGGPWLRFDVPTGEVKAGHTRTFSTPTENDLNPYEGKFTIAIGTYGFSIHYKNALQGANETLFSGKFTVGKVSESQGIPQMKNVYNFYVDHDWALPLGYVWLHAQEETDRDPHLMAAMWFRGNTDGQGLEAHLLYQGKEVATADSPDSEVAHNTATGGKNDPRWALMAFTFYQVRRASSGDYNGAYFLDKNPGEYEVKVLRGGKLSRDMRFAVGDGGQITDTGIGDSNRLGTKRVLVPVKVLGTADGTYDASAWKTDAFYGNPLTGFTAP